MDRRFRLGSSTKRPVFSCLLSSSAALLLLCCLMGKAKATGWYYRFMPIQREDHKRLLLELSSSKTTGSKEAQDGSDSLWAASSVGRLTFYRLSGGAGQLAPERETGQGLEKKEAFRVPTIDAGQQNGSFRAPAFSGPWPDREVEEFWFEQPLDHGNPLVFNRPSHDEWKQKAFSAKVKSPCRSVGQQAGRQEQVSGGRRTRTEGGRFGKDMRWERKFSRSTAGPRPTKDYAAEACPLEKEIRPVFVYIGGEGPLSRTEVQAGKLCV